MLNNSFLFIYWWREKAFWKSEEKIQQKEKCIYKCKRSGAGSKEANAAEQELKRYDFLSWLTRYLRLKDTHSNLGETFSREDGDDSMYMESALHGSENEIEDENQLNWPETINSLKTSSNLKKNSKNKKSGKNLQEKEYEVLEKLGKSLTEEDKDDADDVSHEVSFWTWRQ